MSILKYNGKTVTYSNKILTNNTFFEDVKIFIQDNSINSLYYDTSWSPFTSTKLAFLHGFIKVENYIYATTRSAPLKLLKINVDDFNNYSILEFTGTADFDTIYSGIDKIIYSSTRNRIYGVFSDNFTSAYDKKITVIEINPITLAYSIVINETLTPYSGFGPQITCDSSYLYVTTSAGFSTDAIFKYNLSNFAYVSKINIGNSTEVLHSTVRDPYSKYIYTAEYSYGSSADLFKIDTETMLYDSSLSIPSPGLTDEFAITENHLFIGVEDSTRRIYKIDKNNLSSYSYITLSSEVTPCYGLTYDGTWIWGTYATVPGKLLRMNPNDMSYIVYDLDSSINNINGFINDNNRIFLTSWEHPAKLSKLKKSKYL